MANLTLKDKPAKFSKKRGKNGMFNALYTDIAVDLGTANTLICEKNKGVILNEPSVVALNSTGKVVAVGHEARLMHEKTHKNIRTVSPLKGGVIADFDIAELMIRELVKKINQKWYSKIRRMIVCVPSGITDVERGAVRDSASNAGAKEVYIVDETIAAAVGMGADVNEPVGNMIVDVGGGTTEIAIISLGGIVYSSSVRIGGDKLNEDIVNYFRRKFNLLIGERTGEQVKIEVGSATKLDKELEMLAKGRDIVKGVPKNQRVTSEDVREAISESVNTYLEAITKSLEQTPPELSADIIDRGIMLTGGGALLRNLDKLITESTNLPVHMAESPLTTVAEGMGMILGDLEGYRNLIS